MLNYLFISSDTSAGPPVLKVTKFAWVYLHRYQEHIGPNNLQPLLNLVRLPWLLVGYKWIQTELAASFVKLQLGLTGILSRNIQVQAKCPQARLGSERVFLGFDQIQENFWGQQPNSDRILSAYILNQTVIRRLRQSFTDVFSQNFVELLLGSE